MIYARIDGGAIAELCTLADGISIETVFHPLLLWVDVTTAAPPPAVGWTAALVGGAWSFTGPAGPTLAQQAAALLAGGLTIASTGTPGIDGVYRCDPESRATIAEVVSGINSGRGFPGGGGTFDFDLATGHVTFAATATFIAVAVAIQDFGYQINQVLAGRSSTLPPASTSIA